MTEPQTIEKDRGIAGFTLTPDEARSPLWRRFQAALDEELHLLRVRNDAPADIKDTTLLRGELRCVKRISARTAEVGRESRQSEPLGPESASASTAGGILWSDEQ